MSAHEFGIMERTPLSGERYDAYEPEKYGCIQVDDALVEKLDWDLQSVDCFWHTVDKVGKGLAYCGITLIPPASLRSIIAVLDEKRELAALKRLLEQAEREDKFVIHFGI